MRIVRVLVCAALVASCSGAENNASSDDCTGAVVFVTSSFGPMTADAGAGGCLGSATVSSASSTVLAAQISDGAPVDVFVSAGTDSVSSLQSQGVTTLETATIGYNTAALMLSTQSTAPDAVASVEDLVGVDLVLGACVASVPCGQLTDTVLSRAIGSGDTFRRDGVVDTEVLNAADLVSKIAMGEIDAGIVYRSDCAASARPGSERCIDIASETTSGRPLNTRVPYVAVRLSDSQTARTVFGHLTGSRFSAWLADKFGIEAP